MYSSVDAWRPEWNVLGRDSDASSDGELLAGISLNRISVIGKEDSGYATVLVMKAADVRNCDNFTLF